ncbi:MAG: DNA-processing protein DprA [Acidimicrobiales bacterium]
MATFPAQRRLLALCAIEVERQAVDWSLVAREAQLPGGLDSLWGGAVQERGAAAERSRRVLRQGLRQPEQLFARVDRELDASAGVGARLVTVLDPEYPANLRMVHNLPPFLFVRGSLEDADVRSVAVVGTRRASEVGMRRAARMARLLSERGVTVVSGLARGVDTAVHRAALAAGGRTAAVLGTGILRTYPPENGDLAAEIADRGALVSQFWPTRAPTKDTFPRRNVVMSGLTQGTVVIEAGNMSGARMQARLAIEHGKSVFLLRSLVNDQPWAQSYVRRRGAIEVGDVDEVVEHLAAPDRVIQLAEQRRQLSFASL